ncbi:MAG: hypothetical protein JWM08_2409 [Candidatus Angelobacter sp.]|jgi:hypothetical protein|nr:hypothetical protein [Candidatus Angelobacter sp.]
MPLLSLNPFVLRLDKTNPGVMECHCSVCNRLVAASRELRVLEIVQRIHIDKWHLLEGKLPKSLVM